jgi:hypothetical protein
MSHTHKSKPYIVRGFDVTAGQFNSFGDMSSLSNTVEKVVDKQHDAVAAMLTGDIGKMAPSAFQLGGISGFVVNDLRAAPDLTPQVVVIDIKVVTGANSQADLRPFRSEVREILKRWAEKCRLPGLRGWRANAIKTPTFEFDSNLTRYVIRTQVVLGTAVFYNSNRVTLGAPRRSITTIRSSGRARFFELRSSVASGDDRAD